MTEKQTFKKDGVRISLTHATIDLSNIEDLPTLEEDFFGFHQAVDDYDADPWVVLDLAKSTVDEFMEDVRTEMVNLAKEMAEKAEKVDYKPVDYSYEVKVDKRKIPKVEHLWEWWDDIETARLGLPGSIPIVDTDIVDDNMVRLTLKSYISLEKFHQYFMSAMESANKGEAARRKEERDEAQRKVKVLQKETPKLLQLAEALRAKGIIRDDLYRAFQVLDRAEELSKK